MRHVPPRSTLGWGVRLVLVSLIALGLSTLLTPYMAMNDPAMTMVLVTNTLVIGMPMAGGLLWALAVLGRDYQRLEKITAIDPVTALPNRAAFIELTERILRQSGVLLLLDIDDFRTINEKRGRAAGDSCLRALAMRFRELTRTTDVAGRMDGASCAVYLPGATVEQAHEIATRLCQNSLLVSGETKFGFTASAGAVFADGHTPLEHLLRDAEAALERAKLKGRATVVLDQLRLVA